MNSHESCRAYRPDEDPAVIAAIAEDRRPSTDIWIVLCPWDGWYSYWNQGSHANCRKCGRDLTGQTADAITLADYWDSAIYPCDEMETAGGTGE